MDEITGPLLSVRGHARLTVDPDYAALSTVLSSVRGSKKEALQAAALSLERLTADLAGLGAVALSTQTARGALSRDRGTLR
ncbi:MAG: hypothetical protein ACLPUO_25820 [Streptosporangiaceae bacterium]|jgi:hypothetical protein